MHCNCKDNFEPCTCNLKRVNCEPKIVVPALLPPPPGPFPPCCIPSNFYKTYWRRRPCNCGSNDYEYEGDCLRCRDNIGTNYVKGLSPEF